ncbi:MAG: NAD(P)H nitroreductase [Actinomycetota bacterium]|nr:NAD(P)H nitroreductase [Actinomycetota bacterium]
MRYAVVDADVISEAVGLACRAPSLHNSQPWRFIVEGDAVHLFLDADRAPRHTDTTGREALFSCGAVLDHLRVAMAAAGWRAHVERFPNPNNPDHLASLSFSPMEFVTEGHRRRAEAIAVRRTDRLPFAAPPDWEAFLQRLGATLDSVWTRVDVIADRLRPQLAEASRMTRSLRLYDSPYHAEIVGWTTDVGITEGIPKSALISAAETDRVEIGRADFPKVAGEDRRADIGTDHAKVLVLSTYDDTREAMLRCGEQLSAALLDATMAGLATCTLTHITEVPESREIVTTLLDAHATPQVLIRVGQAPGTDDSAPPTPRRPVDEVLEFSD